MFKKRSIVLFICALLSSAYSIFLICYFGNASINGGLGGAFATALVTPHMITIVLGTIFTLLGFFLKKAWPALVGAILFCVALIVFMVYFMYCIPLIVLGFIGYANQRKIEHKE